MASLLHGSYPRDEARSGSDIDILVDFAAGRAPSFARYAEAYHQLEDVFPGLEVSLGTRENLVSVYRPYVEGSALRVF